ncbi:peptidyl-Lys metalloendopeptidase [Flagelloscypha sp. PMI_526]|nr:peptidyl-Lys metalloendopeptidase [Flagelloscypha sp. PMI_526]
MALLSAFRWLFALHLTTLAWAQSLNVTLYGADSLDENQNLTVITSVKNIGDVALKILNDPRGVLTNFSTNKFNVSHEIYGGVPFVGAVVKFQPESLYGSNDSSPFTFLEPGQAINVTHNLNDAYNFSAFDFNLTDGSFLAVSTFTLAFHVANDTGTEFKIIKIDPGSLRPIWVFPRWVPWIIKYLPHPHETFIMCTQQQQSAITSAAIRAASYANEAFNYLSSHMVATPRYTTWFGEYDSGRHDLVLSHFQSIRGNDFLGFTYDCQCNWAGYWAYVHASDFGFIHLCPAFWTSPISGTDSKAGTLIHEASHFIDNGGTVDSAAGQAAALALAIKSPAKAIMNGDSHEYFAENTPTLT